jgi:hypothetical protein
LTTSDIHEIMATGVAYAEPPWIVPSTILDGGKGTPVSGRGPGRSSRAWSLGDFDRDVEGQMTANKNFKRRVRARAAKTGQSYTAALRHFRPNPTGVEVPKRMRLAVAQTTLRGDPRNRDELRASGREIRQLMSEAREAGARLIHFPEGATCSPHKLIMSINGPDKVGASDWDRLEWDVLQEELKATAALARELNSGPCSAPSIGSLLRTVRTTACM